MTSLTSRQTEFIETVLRLNPRIATFDCDGTLWSGDAGEGFFAWELEQGLVSKEIAGTLRARYADYRAGQVAEDVMCGEMVTMHRGLREEVVKQACDTYFAHAVAPNIFPEMRELIERLHASACDVWAVSSSNQWIIRSGMRHFGIPQIERHPTDPTRSPPTTGPIAPSATRSGIARCWPCPNTHLPSTRIRI